MGRLFGFWLSGNYIPGLDFKVFPHEVVDVFISEGRVNFIKLKDLGRIAPMETLWSCSGNLPTDWNVHKPHIVRAMGELEREVVSELHFTGLSFTMPRTRSAYYVLS